MTAWEWTLGTTDFTVVNAYEPVPRLGATRSLPQVADAMRDAAGQTFDVRRYREAVERLAAWRIGFDDAVAVAGARAGLCLAALLAARRRPYARIAAVHPSPRTIYSAYLTPANLDLREIDLDLDLRDTDVDNVALALITLRASGNDLQGVLATRAACASHGIPLVINAAAAPWPELGVLAAPGALVVTSASKSQRGPSASGFLLIGSEWQADAEQVVGEPITGLLRPGKEAVAGLDAVLGTLELAAGPGGQADRLSAVAVLELLGFDAQERQRYWRGGPSPGGSVYVRAYSAAEGGANAADRIATRLWNFEPPIVVGCTDNVISLSFDRLNALECDYVAAALASTTEWALRGADGSGQERL